MCKQKVNYFSSNLLVCPCNCQHSGKSLNNLKEKCVYPSQLPQKLYQQHSPTPMMRSDLPTSPKPEMKNHDIKELWIILKPHHQNLMVGAVRQSCHLVNQTMFFLILRGNLALHLVRVVSVVFSCDIISPTRGSI